MNACDFHFHMYDQSVIDSPLIYDVHFFHAVYQLHFPTLAKISGMH